MKYINEKALDAALEGEPGIEGMRVLHDLSAEWREACGRVFSRMGGLSPLALGDIIGRVDDYKAVCVGLGLLEKLLAVNDKFPPAHTAPAVAPLTSDNLSDAFALIESCSLRAAYIFLNAREFADLRKFGREIMTVESRVSLLKMGMIATIWGAMVITSNKIPAGTVWVTTEDGLLFPSETEFDFFSMGEKEIPIQEVIMETPIGYFNRYGVCELTVTR